ncbi:MAG: 1,2-phenylacetyl-CoA epoxidase subunit PaaD [Deinococcaceae bacterium]
MDTKSRVWEILSGISDPEIPVLSLVDLGIIETVLVGEEIHVEILPTFSGCPALDFIQQEIGSQLEVLGFPVSITINRTKTWTSNRLTEQGRKVLQASGFAPPPIIPLEDSPPLHLGNGLACPHCGSTQTVLDSPFGPTPCRALYRCLNCRQPFEQFKPI